MRSAPSVLMTPICEPSSPIKRTSGTRMRSLIRVGSRSGGRRSNLRGTGTRGAGGASNGARLQSRRQGQRGEYSGGRVCRMALDTDLRARRETIVREHAESENRQEFDVTLATFDHPRYELIPTGEGIDGTEAVAAYYRETPDAFPDQRNPVLALHHPDDAVLLELELTGTHRGDFRGLPATGRSFRCRMLAVFLFEDDRLTCERVYFDQNTILRQLGVAHDPLTLTGRISTVLNHPVTIGGALLRRLRSRS